LIKNPKELLEIVSQVDDLGPEVAFNLPMLAAYRNHSNASVQYLEVQRAIIKKHSWDAVLKETLKGGQKVINVKEENEKLDSVDWYNDEVQQFNKKETGISFPKELVETAPIVFHIINICLAECTFP